MQPLPVKAEVQVHHRVGWGVPVPLPGGPGATEALHQLAKDDSVVAAFTLTNGGRGEVGGGGSPLRALLNVDENRFVTI
jgi:hypothetical protein